jgi:hypothetical protein
MVCHAPALLRLPLWGCNRAHDVPCARSKTRGMGAGRKLQIHRRNQRWADKDYKKSHLGSEWKKPFAGGARVLAGLVLTPPARQQGRPWPEAGARTADRAVAAAVGFGTDDVLRAGCAAPAGASHAKGIVLEKM